MNDAAPFFLLVPWVLGGVLGLCWLVFPIYVVRLLRRIARTLEEIRDQQRDAEAARRIEEFKRRAGAGQRQD